MDKAAIKMIEGKKYKEQFQAASKALAACDSIKFVYKNKETIYIRSLSDLKTVIVNDKAIVENWKIIATNEKKKGNRKGLFAFCGGTLTGAIVAFFVFR